MNKGGKIMVKISLDDGVNGNRAIETETTIVIGLDAKTNGGVVQLVQMGRHSYETFVLLFSTLLKLPGIIIDKEDSIMVKAALAQAVEMEMNSIAKTTILEINKH